MMMSRNICNMIIIKVSTIMLIAQYGEHHHAQNGEHHHAQNGEQYGEQHCVKVGL